ncbi:MAG: FtsX-like permease family protein [Roseivirga sp.]|nr:FtsX-like permease family protein [Roseivirga sp.]
MLKNYLIAYLRNIWRNKLISAINIFGLAIGTSTVLLAIVYLDFEHSYDDFYEDEIGRVVGTHSYQDRPTLHMGTLPYDMGAEIRDKVPEVNGLTRIKGSNLTSVVASMEQPDQYFNEAGLVYADGNYFDFFKIDLLAGSKQSFSENTRSVVLSESAALKYFGQQNPLGKLLEIKNQELLLEVVGIMPDYPANSSIRFHMVASVEALRSLPNAESTYFSKRSWAYQTFIKTTDRGVATEKINHFDEANLYKIRENQAFYIEPITDLHFKSQTSETFYASKGNAQLLLWFSIIAGIVLLFAIINYGNVLTANALKRVKEVGVRKIIGANRTDVLLQMVFESLVTSLFAMVVGFLLIELTLPYLGNFVQRDLLITPVYGLNFYLFSLLLALVIGVVSGAYPALVLSGINTLNLKKEGTGLRSKKNLGSALIIFQFVASMVLISIAFYMNRQLDYVTTKDLGFNTDNTLVIKNLNTSPDKVTLLQNELLLEASVGQAAISDFIPGEKTFRASKVKAGFNRGGEKLEMALLGIDEYFTELYQIDIFDNSNPDTRNLFSKGSQNVLVNEATSAAFEGSLIGGTFSGLFVGQGEYVVQGVIRDFHVASLHNEIAPFALIPVSGSYGSRHLSVRYLPGTDKQELLSTIKSKFAEIMPEVPFDLSFSGEGLAQAYADELRTGTMINVLTLLSIALSSAGILGITLAITGQRRKEISIRKILGAGLAHLLLIQNKRFILLIGVAFTLAAPLAYLSANWWKNDFVYKVDFSLLSLAVPLCIMLCCTFLVSGWLTFKTATTNPVNSIRYE